MHIMAGSLQLPINANVVSRIEAAEKRVEFKVFYVDGTSDWKRSNVNGALLVRGLSSMNSSMRYSLARDAFGGHGSLQFFLPMIA